jgi:hypothetical protein
MQRGALTSPSFCPVWLDLSDFVRIFEGLLIVSLGCVGSRSIRVKDVVCRLDRNRLGKLVTAFYSVTFQCIWGMRSVVFTMLKVNRGVSTYTASSKFFSAMALLPRALSSSAMLDRRLSELFDDSNCFLFDI